MALAKQIVKYLAPIDVAGFEALDRNITPPARVRRATPPSLPLPLSLSLHY